MGFYSPCHILIFLNLTHNPLWGLLVGSFGGVFTQLGVVVVVPFFAVFGRQERRRGIAGAITDLFLLCLLICT